MKDKIIQMLSNAPELPVLFIGSGLTRRYLNLPNWEGLLRQYCVKSSYEYYYSKAEREYRDCPDMIYPKIADYIEADYNDAYFTEDKFSDSWKIHADDISKKISPLKFCMADFFKEKSENIQDEYIDEVNLFRKIGNKNVSCIITTNYDLFLENSFGKDHFQTYIGQNELLFSTIYEVAEIYKIHGCCSKPDSIVINSYDYDLFIRKSAYLSSKILTLFLERPIIFLGYSVSDPNIRRILRSISDCLENSQLEQLKKRLIFIEWAEKQDNEGISERQFDFDNGKTIAMENIRLFDYSTLYSAILNNTVKYDVKALRRIKSQLYELVKTNQPTEKLYIATNIEDDSQDIDFVVGVGVFGKFGKVGYRGIKAEELYLYAIGKSELQYDDDMILKEAIPYLYNGRTIWPVRQFISRCQTIDCINDKVKFSLNKSSKDLLSLAQKEAIKKRGYTDLPCIVDYYRQNGLSKTISSIFTSDFEKMDSEDLLQFIKLALEDEPALLSITGKGHQSRSNFKKCISLWDILVYSESASQRIMELSQN